MLKHVKEPSQTIWVLDRKRLNLQNQTVHCVQSESVDIVQYSTVNYLANQPVFYRSYSDNATVLCLWAFRVPWRSRVVHYRLFTTAYSINVQH